MTYNPQIHHRRSIRLKGYDYSINGSYFITISTFRYTCLFGNISEGQMYLNNFGKIVDHQWQRLNEHFPEAIPDTYVVMPNHIHGILKIRVGGMDDASGFDAQGAPVKGARTAARSVGEIVGGFKSLCSYHCLKWIKKNAPHRRMGKLWHRNYWERIIRDDRELENIRNYIRQNPARWNSK